MGRVTADGMHALFQSTDRLTSYDNNGKYEVYLFDAASGEVVCASCNPSGTPATTGARALGSGDEPGIARTLSEDGRYVFFNTTEALVPTDVNNRMDAYQYDARRNRIDLISTGTSEFPAEFEDASADGADVFITTRQKLLSSDFDDSVDVYDARAGGGFASQSPPPPPIPCAGEACRTEPVVPPAAAAPASSIVAGKGNVKQQRKSSHKKKSKKHKKTHKQKKQQEEEEGQEAQEEEQAEAGQEQEAGGSSMNQISTRTTLGAPARRRAGLAVALLAVVALMAAFTASARAEFGFEKVDGESVADEGGAPAVLAGSHPWQSSVSLDFNNHVEEVGGLTLEIPDGSFNNVQTILPPGQVGSALATPRCSIPDFANPPAYAPLDCPNDTAVGWARVKPNWTPYSLYGPVYNLTPSFGEPALFGFRIASATIYLHARVRSGAERRGDAGKRGILTGPADHGHERRPSGACRPIPATTKCAAAASRVRRRPASICPSTAAPRPLINYPTACSGPIEDDDADGLLGEPGAWVEDSFLSHGADGIPVGLEKCEELGFEPRMNFAMQPSSAASPGSLDVTMSVPQNDSPDGRVTAHLKKVVATLPEGVTLNSASADGLGFCTEAQIRIDQGVRRMPGLLPDRHRAGEDAPARGRTRRLAVPREAERQPVQLADRPLPGDRKPEERRLRQDRRQGRSRSRERSPNDDLRRAAATAVQRARIELRGRPAGGAGRRRRPAGPTPPTTCSPRGVGRRSAARAGSRSARTAPARTASRPASKPAPPTRSRVATARSRCGSPGPTASRTSPPSRPPCPGASWRSSPACRSAATARRRPAAARRRARSAPPRWRRERGPTRSTSRSRARRRPPSTSPVLIREAPTAWSPRFRPRPGPSTSARWR